MIFFSLMHYNRLNRPCAHPEMLFFLNFGPRVGTTGWQKVRAVNFALPPKHSFQCQYEQGPALTIIIIVILKCVLPHPGALLYFNYFWTFIPPRVPLHSSMYFKVLQTDPQTLLLRCPSSRMVASTDRDRGLQHHCQLLPEMPRIRVVESKFTPPPRTQLLGVPCLGCWPGGCREHVVSSHASSSRYQ